MPERGKARATLIETFLRQVVGANGGLGFFHDLALLGAVRVPKTPQTSPKGRPRIPPFPQRPSRRRFWRSRAGLMPRTA